MREWAGSAGRSEALRCFLSKAGRPVSPLLPLPPSLPYFSVSPQLVALHAVAVVEGDWTGVGDGVKAELLGVLGVSRPDVLSPGEGEHLCTWTS